MTEHGWEILAAETVYSDEWIRLEHEHVRLPNGYEIPTYNVIRQPDFCQRWPQMRLAYPCD